MAEGVKVRVRVRVNVEKATGLAYAVCSRLRRK
jgi:hypothetical protein